MPRDYDDEDDDDRPRRKKRGRDDEDDDDRPRRKKRKRAPKKSSSMGLVLGLVGGGLALLLLIGVGVGAYLVMNQPTSNAGKPGGGGNTPAPIPGVSVTPVPGGGIGWTTFRQPDGLYSVKLPPGCLLPQFSELKPAGGDKQSTVLTGNREMAVGMKVRVLSPASLAQEQKNLQDLRGNRRQITWLGRAAVEESDPNDRFGKVVRQFLDGDRLFHFEIGGLPRKPTDQERATFFDSVVIH